MKQSDIKVGKKYRNRGKGLTERFVTGIGVEFRPSRRYSTEKPDASAEGVQYHQRRAGSKAWSSSDVMWLDSFASWAGAEVVE